jgi:3-oxoacyl-[acyl-carrier-protein] synthase-3
MVKSGRSALSMAGLAPADVTLWAPHQANSRIVGAVQNRLSLERATVLGSLRDYGNSSAATVPLSLSLATAGGRDLSGQTALLSAFGAGSLWASAVWRS